MVELELATPDWITSIPVLMDTVPINVPPLLGLDILDGEQLYAENVTNRLVHRKIESRHGEPLKYTDKWSVPLVRFDNHLYAKMKFPEYTIYSTAQFEKMHRNFAHPSAEK